MCYAFITILYVEVEDFHDVSHLFKVALYIAQINVFLFNSQV